MSDQKNQAPAAVPKAADMLEQWVHQVLFCTVQGAMSSMFNIPREAILLIACRMLGRIAGQLFVGETAAVLKFRSDCIDGFRAEMKAVPIVGMPAEKKPREVTAA